MDRSTSNVLKKANLLVMIKHATEKDCSLKMQLMVSKANSLMRSAVRRCEKRQDFIKMNALISK